LQRLLIPGLVALVILFGITGVGANLCHSNQKSLAYEWFARVAWGLPGWLERAGVGFDWVRSKARSFSINHLVASFPKIMDCFEIGIL